MSISPLTILWNNALQTAALDYISLQTSQLGRCHWTGHLLMHCDAVHFCLFRMNDVKITEISKFQPNPIVSVDIIGWKLGQLPDGLQSTAKDIFQIIRTEKVYLHRMAAVMDVKNARFCNIIPCFLRYTLTFIAVLPTGVRGKYL